VAVAARASSSPFADAGFVVEAGRAPCVLAAGWAAAATPFAWGGVDAGPSGFTASRLNPNPEAPFER